MKILFNTLAIALLFGATSIPAATACVSVTGNNIGLSSDPMYEGRVHLDGSNCPHNSDPGNELRWCGDVWNPDGSITCVELARGTTFIDLDAGGLIPSAPIFTSVHFSGTGLAGGVGIRFARRPPNPRVEQLTQCTSQRPSPVKVRLTLTNPYDQDTNIRVSYEEKPAGSKAILGKPKKSSSEIVQELNYSLTPGTYVRTVRATVASPYATTFSDWVNFTMDCPFLPPTIDQPEPSAGQVGQEYFFGLPVHYDTNDRISSYHVTVYGPGGETVATIDTPDSAALKFIPGAAGRYTYSAYVIAEHGGSSNAVQSFIDVRPASASIRISDFHIWQIVDDPKISSAIEPTLDLMNNKNFAIRVQIVGQDTLPVKNADVLVKIQGGGFQADERTIPTDGQGRVIITGRRQLNDETSDTIRFKVRKNTSEDYVSNDQKINFINSKQVNLNFWRLKKCQFIFFRCYSEADPDRYSSIMSTMGEFSDRVLPISKETNIFDKGTFSGNGLPTFTSIRRQGGNTIAEDLLNVALLGFFDSQGNIIRRSLGGGTSGDVKVNLGVVNDEYFLYQGHNDPNSIDAQRLGAYNSRLGAGVIREQSQSTTSQDSSVGMFILSQILGVGQEPDKTSTFESWIEKDSSYKFYSGLVAIENIINNPLEVPKDPLYPVSNLGLLWISPTSYPKYARVLKGGSFAETKPFSQLQPLLLVSGVFSDDSFTPYYWYTVDAGKPSVSEPDPNISVRTYDVNDSLINTLSVDRTEGIGLITRGGVQADSSIGEPVLLSIPFASQAARVEIVKNGIVVFEVSPLAKVLRDAVALAPDTAFIGNATAARANINSSLENFNSLVVNRDYARAGNLITNEIQPKIRDLMVDQVKESVLDKSKSDIRNLATDISIRATVISNQVHNGPQVFVKLSSDKSFYSLGERAKMKACFVAAPENRDLEYYLEAKFNGSSIRVDRVSDREFKSISPALDATGIWIVSTYIQNRRIAQSWIEFINVRRQEIFSIEAELERTTDPNEIQALNKRKANLLSEIQKGKAQLAKNRTKLSVDYSLSIAVQ